MYCIKCGNEIAEGSSFCDQCGEPVAKQPAAQPEAVTPAESAAPAEQPESAAEAESATEPESVTDTAAQPQTYAQAQPFNQAPPFAPSGSGFESYAPKKSVSGGIIAAAVCAVLVVAVAVIAAVIFTGKPFKYKKALKLIDSKNYAAAFKILDKLGDYEDAESYLPFHGKYTSISVTDRRTYEFTDGKYEEVIPGDEKDSVYNGHYSVDGYEKATLTDDDDDEKETFGIFDNCIYNIEKEDFVFDEKLDVSGGNAEGKITEIMVINLSSVSMKLVWEYKFNADGTYTYSDRAYADGSSTSFYDTDEEGTYELNGNYLTIKPDSGKAEKTYLVIDGLVYRDVYERDYTAK